MLIFVFPGDARATAVAAVAAVAPRKSPKEHPWEDVEEQKQKQIQDKAKPNKHKNDNRSTNVVDEMTPAITTVSAPSACGPAAAPRCRMLRQMPEDSISRQCPKPPRIFGCSACAVQWQ